MLVGFLYHLDKQNGHVNSKTAMRCSYLHCVCGNVLSKRNRKKIKKLENKNYLCTNQKKQKHKMPHLGIYYYEIKAKELNM